MNTIKEQIKEFFEENEEVFNECIEELDSYNGWLGDDRYYEMSMIDELYCNSSPSEVLERAFYGHDDESWTTNSYGEKEYGEFNPNRDYFYFNGYGNLVSADYKDYFAYLDDYLIDSLAENRCYVDAIESNDELSALFDKL